MFYDVVFDFGDDVVVVGWYFDSVYLCNINSNSFIFGGDENNFFVYINVFGVF